MIHPVDRVEILVSPLNITIGLVLGLLVGLNIATAWYLVASARACRTPRFGRTRTFSGLLGALPAFAGMACCAPALLIVVGAQSPYSSPRSAAGWSRSPSSAWSQRSCGTSTEPTSYPTGRVPAPDRHPTKALQQSLCQPADLAPSVLG